MAIALVTTVTGSSPDANTFTTSSGDTTGATLLVAVVSNYEPGGEPTISDSKSCSWTQLTVQSSVNNRVRISYAENPTVGTGHTFTLTGNGAAASIVVYAFSGTATSSVFDQQNGGTVAGATSGQPGNVTPGEDNEVLVTGICMLTATVPSINSSFSTPDTIAFSSGAHLGIGASYKIQTTGGSENPTWSWSNNDSLPLTIATFKAPSVGGGTNPSLRLNLLGVG